jgi:UDP-N-acetylmuramoyl-tripeptide--D-alanyl-D-alanine ligase
MMGAYAAACPLDLVVFVGGENADEMARAASIMGMSEDIVVRAPTAEAAAELVGPVLAPGDLVLAKGSRSVGLDRFVKAVL